MLLTENKLRKLIRSMLKEAAYAQLPGYVKGKELEINDFLKDPANPELRDEVIDAINKSYDYLGPGGKGGRHFDYNQADHLISNNDLDAMYAWDIDDDPQPDVVIGAKRKHPGYDKLVLSATDMARASIDYSKAEMVRRFMNGEAYGELSGAAAGAMMKAGVPVVTDPDTIERILKKKVEYVGEYPYKDSRTWAKSKREGPNGEYDHWYGRQVGGPKGMMVYKILFGKNINV